MQAVAYTNLNPNTNRSIDAAFGYSLRVHDRHGIFLITRNGNTINLDFNYLFTSILKLFVKDVTRNFVPNTKQLERFSMRQSLRLVLKVKPFKIFTAIHNSINLVGSEDRTFN